jgi:hypothetical protein
MSAARNTGVAILGLALAAVMALAVRHMVVVVQFPYPVEYPEGITTHWTHQAAKGASLYPAVDAAGPLHNPYPPLFYRIAALFPQRGSNPFLASRLTALAGLIACGVTIAWLLRRSGIGRALLGALLFMLSTTVIRYGSTARVDMPGLGLALVSIAMLSGGGSSWRVAAAGFLAGGALLTKPTFLAAAAAGLVVSGGRGWRALVSWTAGFALAMVVGVRLFGAQQAAVIEHLWTLNQLPWHLSTLGALAGQELARHPIVIAGFVLFMFRTAATRNVFWWYAVFACAGAGLAGKTGADANYFLELIAVACIGAVRLGGVGEGSATPETVTSGGGLGPCLARGTQVMPLLAAIQVLMYLPIEPAAVFTRTYEQELAGRASRYTPLSSEAEAGALVVAELRQAGTVLSQSPGLMIAAGRAPTWDAYQFTQRARAGRWDDAPLAQRLADGAFDLVLLQSDTAAAEDYFPPRVRQALDEGYELSRELGPWRLMRRK